MTAYTPPNENLSSFNSSLFVSADSNLTISEADMLYYRKWISDLKYPILLNSNTFTGALNTFSNAISVMGINISSNASSALTNINIGSTSNSSGQYNICMGQGAAPALTTGQYNIVSGYGSMNFI